MSAGYVFADPRGVETSFSITGAGPALLLIHGAEATRHMFDSFVPYLATRYRVVAYDQRDCGETTYAENAYGVLDLAADAANLIDHLGEGPIPVFGTSFGGAVAQGLIHLHPEKVSALVLSSTWPIGRRLADFNRSATEELARLRTSERDCASEIAAYYFSQSFIQEKPEWIELFRPKALTSARQRRLAMLEHLLNGHEPLSLEAFVGPTLVLAGSDDRLIPPEVSLELTSTLPHARSTLLQGVPHTGAIECPELVANAVLTFLKEVDSSSAK